MKLLSHTEINFAGAFQIRYVWEVSGAGYSVPFFRLIVQVGRSPIGVAFGILWNGGVFRVNVAPLNPVAIDQKKKTCVLARSTGKTEKDVLSANAEGTGCAANAHAHHAPNWKGRSALERKMDRLCKSICTNLARASKLEEEVTAKLPKKAELADELLGLQQEAAQVKQVIEKSVVFQATARHRIRSGNVREQPHRQQSECHTYDRRGHT